MRIAARIVGYLAFAACVVLLRTCLKDQYDADAVKGYLRDAVCVEVRKVDCTPVEYLIAKFRLKLEKVRKATRPFRSDLNQIPYTGEVMNTAEVIIQQR